MLSKFLSEVALSIFCARGTQLFGVNTKLERFRNMMHGAVHVCVSGIDSKCFTKGFQCTPLPFGHHSRYDTITISFPMKINLIDVICVTHMTRAYIL
jgi:hypothetical protein